jgi:hypothetical protein
MLRFASSAVRADFAGAGGVLAGLFAAGSLEHPIVRRASARATDLTTTGS